MINNIQARVENILYEKRREKDIKQGKVGVHCGFKSLATNEVQGVKKARVFNFIKEYIKENGIAPSLSDIRGVLKTRHTDIAYFYLNKLQNDGLITFERCNKDTFRKTLRVIEK